MSFKFDVDELADEAAQSNLKRVREAAQPVGQAMKALFDDVEADPVKTQNAVLLLEHIAQVIWGGSASIPTTSTPVAALGSGSTTSPQFSEEDLRVIEAIKATNGGVLAGADGVVRSVFLDNQEKDRTIADLNTRLTTANGDKRTLQQQLNDAQNSPVDADALTKLEKERDAANTARDKAVSERDAANTAKDKAVSDLTTANTDKAAAVSDLNTVTAERDLVTALVDKLKKPHADESGTFNKKVRIEVPSSKLSDAERKLLGLPSNKRPKAPASSGSKTRVRSSS